MKSPKIRTLYVFAICCLINACQTDISDNGVVRVRIEKFPNTINPLISQSNIAHLIQRNVFNSLIDFSYDGSLRPLIANKLPVIVKKDSVYHLHYSIREEARWDDLTPILAKDVIFSLKVFKLPIDVSRRSRVYYEQLLDIIPDKSNSRKFTIVGQGNPSNLTLLSGDFDIFQRDKYDNSGVLDSLTLKEINEGNVQDLIDGFVQSFLKDNFYFSNAYFNGSGPYVLDQVEPGKFIRLKIKKDWWGNSLPDDLDYISAYPEEINYINIPEPLLAMQALKEQSLDVMSDIPSSDFISLSDNKAITSKYNLYSPLKYRFTYIGFNTRLKKYSQRRVRKAIAHLIDREKIIEKVELGYADIANGPINPANEYFSNNDLLSYEFNPEKAKVLIESTQDRLNEVHILTRQDPIYESIMQVLKYELEKLGVKVTTSVLDGRTVSKRSRNHDFEILIGSFSGNPYSLNFSVLFGTDAAQLSGLNYTGFGNVQTDSLIRKANYAVDSLEKRDALYALQEELHDEATMVFLYFSQNKIAISKKFDEASLNISTVRPGYDIMSFRLN